ncbi:alpha-L-fucosidase [Echinicola marina]|uniref:alpha-L-fucosidase n=1 Tax=Echinicola marina TaxID=2859768 RepID=UPI001CF6F197|nr:alpha-L-fucosidase [Echinicola marina]UCS91877.1 alpha-L-fucosidase [Echinicola marina]
MKKFGLLIKVLLPLQMLAFYAYGQKIKPNHIQFISPGDSQEDIIEKAANVVPTVRQLRWQKLEVTGFIHFGVNTFTGKEWGTGNEKPEIFNPTDLDAEQWVLAAKAGGIKQLIITAKHHDGFCLWPTETTEHSVVSSPWKSGKGDVVKALAEACRKHDMGFGIYLSPWDMNAPSYGTEAYNDLFIDQLTELLTWYGKIDEVWFDGANGEGPNGKKQVYDFDRYYEKIRELQPEAVIAIMGPDVRWVGTETGYGKDTEWSVVPVNNLDQEKIAANSQQNVNVKPTWDKSKEVLGSRESLLNAKGLVWYPAETDVSIRPGWFYHKNQDDKVKSPEKLLDIYFNSVGKNGVLLLNLPPDKRGLIHEEDVKNLKAWKALIDELFDENLLKRATGNKKFNKSLVDGQLETSIVPSKTKEGYEIRFDFKNPIAFNVLVLQENITKGQRVENFQLEVLKDGKWQSVVNGTTIGYKRISTLQEVNGSQFRLKIQDSRLSPEISEVGFYLDKQ